MPRPKSAPTKSSAKPADLRSRTAPPLTERDPVVGMPIYAIRVGTWIESEFDNFLQRIGVTLMQFNLLRILYRDPTNAGLPTGTLGQQMMTRVPDVPRLLDR